MDKHEFGSPSWFEVLFGHLRERLAHVDLGGIEWSQSEEYTDPPMALRRPGRTSVGWHLRIQDGLVHLAAEPADDVDFKVTIGYDVVLPVARIVYSEHEGAPAELEAIQQQLAADPSTETKGDRGLRPAAVEKAFEGIHDDMARVTS